MFDDAFAHGEGQVEPPKGCVALFKPGDNPQGVQVVVEAQAMRPERVVESLFAGVAEGRVADVVGQRQSFGEIGV